MGIIKGRWSQKLIKWVTIYNHLLLDNGNNQYFNGKINIESQQERRY